MIESTIPSWFRTRPAGARGQALAIVGVALVTGVLTDIKPSLGLASCALVGSLAAAVVWRDGPAIITLATFLLTPRALHALPAATYPMIVWICTARRGAAKPGVGSAIAACLGLWIFLSFFESYIHVGIGNRWTLIALCSCVLVPVLRPAFPRPLFMGVTIWLTTAAASYALVEKYLLGYNPLYGNYLASIGFRQHWSAYRATATFDHPLVAGTVFAAVAVLAFSELLRTPHVQVRQIIPVLILCAGLVATQSRLALITTGVIALALLLAQQHERVRLGRRKLVLTALGVVAVAALWGPITQRFGTTEAHSSTKDRQTLVGQTVHLASYVGAFGAGPGESEVYWRKVGSVVSLESSYSELAVSLGYVGVVLFVGLILSYVVKGSQQMETRGLAAALLTVAVCVGGFSALEDHAGLMIFIGLFLAALHSGEASPPAREASTESSAPDNLPAEL
jgi:hypothetical protein